MSYVDITNERVVLQTDCHTAARAAPPRPAAPRRNPPCRPATAVAVRRGCVSSSYRVFARPVVRPDSGPESGIVQEGAGGVAAPAAGARRGRYLPILFLNQTKQNSAITFLNQFRYYHHCGINRLTCVRVV